MVNPYTDSKITGANWVRTFSLDAKEEELIWHQDKKDRVIRVLSGENWKFQRDNEIPFDIKTGDTFSVNKMVYHRLIKGTTDLVITIKEI